MPKAQEDTEGSDFYSDGDDDNGEDWPETITELEKDLFNAKELLESYKRQGMQEPLLNEVRQHIQSLSEKLEHQRIADRDNSSDSQTLPDTTERTDNFEEESDYDAGF